MNAQKESNLWHGKAREAYCDITICFRVASLVTQQAYVILKDVADTYSLQIFYCGFEYIFVRYWYHISEINVRNPKLTDLKYNRGLFKLLSDLYSTQVQVWEYINHTLYDRLPRLLIYDQHVTILSTSHLVNHYQPQTWYISPEQPDRSYIISG